MPIPDGGSDAGKSVRLIGPAGRGLDGSEPKRMRIALFCHSLLSGLESRKCHFLRGIASELCSRGHDVRAYEPRNAWSVRHLIREQGEAATEAVRTVYPRIAVKRYDRETLDLDRALDGADLLMVHEWNDRDLIERIGTHRARSARRVWTWHEAADTRIFHPFAVEASEGDLTWIGNWGDEERTAELHEFLPEPIRALRLRARVYGVRYPLEAQIALRQAGAVSARSAAVSLACGRGLLYDARTGTLCRQGVKRTISARADALRPAPGRDPARMALILSYVP